MVSARATVVLFVLNLALLAQTATSPTLIEKIYIDSGGVAHVVDGDGTDHPQPKEKDQVACNLPKLSEDKRTAGWLVDVPNCCTSYPISLELLLYRPGEPVQHLGDGMLIADWHFLDGGKRVAFSTNTVHGDLAPYYELREVDTGKLVAHWKGHLNAKSPKWARGLTD